MSKFTELTGYLDSLEPYIPARELIVYQNHEKIYHYRSLFADQGKKKKLTGEELYLIYSSSKVATCVGALRLVERKLLNLNDKVSKYLPEYGNMMVQDGNRIRPARTDLLVKHLFTMCGGFSYELDIEPLKRLKQDEYATTRDVIKALAKQPLKFDPGTHFEYSLCHDVLGAVIEVVSKKTLEQYLKDEIFIPLGMYDTVMHLNEEQKERLSLHYVYNPEKDSLSLGDNLFTEFHLSPRYESGGAGIYSTTKDYAKLADAIACGGTGWNGYEVLKPKTVSLYAKDWLGSELQKEFEEKTGHGGQSYGLGAMVLLDKNVHHWSCPEGVFGWGGAAGTKIFMDCKNKLSFYYSQEVIGGPKCSYEEHHHNVIINMLYERL